MKRPARRNRSLVVALYVNAALLFALLAVLLSRGGGGVGSTALAAPAPQTPPIAGGGGIFLMPAQLTQVSWGCYIMDIDTQTLSAYQYLPGENSLKLVASRLFKFDRQLGRYNTAPTPEQVQRWVELEKQPVRGREGAAGRPAGDGAQDVNPPGRVGDEPTR